MLSVANTFMQPAWLALIPALGPLVALGWVAVQRRRRDWEALGQGGAPPSGGDVWWWIAAVLLILAAARPRWGVDPAQAAPPGHDLVIAIDVSRSMAAEDAFPSRLEQAQRLATQLVQKLALDPGERVGVVAFAGRGVIRCPLTDSPGAALDAIAGLRPNSIQPGGSDLAAGLASARQALLGPSESPTPGSGRAVILLSDGEEFGGSAGPVAEHLNTLGIPVHTIALGDTEQGHEVPVLAADGSTEPLRFRGEVVQSRGQPEPLAAISGATGGEFLQIGRAEADLDQLYRDRIEPAERRNRAVLTSASRIDRFPWFVGLALASLVVGLWPVRFRWPGLARAVALGWLAAAVGAAGPGPEHDGLEVGVAAYRAGRLDEALSQFQAAGERHPADPWPSYNTAAVLYQLERFDEAEIAYRRARDRATGTLRLKIDFALGNTAVARGRLSEALASYDACLAGRPGDPAGQRVQLDALANRRFVEVADLARPTRPDPPVGTPASRPSPRTGEGETSPAREGASNGAGLPAPGRPDPRNTASTRSGSPGGSGSNQVAGTRDLDQVLRDALNRIEQARENRSNVRSAPQSRTDQPDW